jgi:hypothetical protein
LFYQAFKELTEKWVKTIEHEGLYFEYWITLILYVLANKSLISNPTLFMGHPQYDVALQWAAQKKVKFMKENFT